MKPLILDIPGLKPLPDDLKGAACKVCGELSSSWGLPEQDAATVCSICLLYETPWGRRNTLQLSEYLIHVEEKRSSVYERSSTGRLLYPADADSIAGVLVWTTKLFAIKDKEAFLGKE